MQGRVARGRQRGLADEVGARLIGAAVGEGPGEDLRVVGLDGVGEGAMILHGV